MNITSWPHLAKRDVRLLRKRKLQMEVTTKVWERFALLPLLVLSIVGSIASVWHGHPEIILTIAFVDVIALAFYGFTRFPGRIIALFLKRLDLKKHQIFRHARWHVRRGVRRLFQYRRYPNRPDGNGQVQTGVEIRSASSTST